MRPHHRHLAADHLGAALSQVLVPFMAGLVLGAAVLAYQCHRRLRWTWSLFIVPMAYGSWLVSWRAGLVLAVAGATAILGGAHLHMEATGRGGEAARAARQAIGPLVVLRSLIADRGARRRRRKGTTLAIGRTRRGSVCRVPIGRPGEGRHVLTVGATGGGKTVSQASILAAHIDAGMAAVAIDPKGDGRLRSTLQASAAAAGVRFREWSPSGLAIYNPIAGGDPDEIADKALAAHEWSEPHYEMATRRLLGLTLATMKAADLWPPTLSGLVDHMQPDRLDALADRAGGALADRVHSYVDGLDSGARSALGGGRDRLAILAEGELGRRLDPALGDGEEIDLAGALERREVVYFRVDADRYPLAARLLAAALVIDLASLAAGRQADPAAAIVLIDEFGSLAAAQVARLLARCRGAGVSLVLGTQSLADLRAVGPGEDTLTEQVISNVAYTIAHRIADPDSAERLARMAGTEPDWTRTEQLGAGFLRGPAGGATRTRERDFVVGPDAFKRLPPGRAIVIDPTATPPAEVVAIWGPEIGADRRGDARPISVRGRI
jgi:DNA helicase HerA-like ATPase